VLHLHCDIYIATAAAAAAAAAAADEWMSTVSNDLRGFVRTVVRNVVCLLSECLFFQKDHILRTSDVINLTSLIKCGPIYLVNALKGSPNVPVASTLYCSTYDISGEATACASNHIVK
jgi:hypothetical protein